MQPGRERACAIEAVEHADGLQERLLGDVLGGVRVARDEVRRAVGLPPVAAVELLDRARVAALGALHERALAARPRLRRERSTPIGGVRDPHVVPTGGAARQVRGAHAATIARRWKASPEFCSRAVARSAWAATRRACRWHGSTLARRAAGLLARCAEPPVIVVCAPDQELPPLPGWVEVVRDPEPGLGPLAGLAAGLAAAGPRAEVAAVCAVDAPLAHPAVMAALLGALGTAPAVVPLSDDAAAAALRRLPHRAGVPRRGARRRRRAAGGRARRARRARGSSSRSSCSSWTTSRPSIPGSPRS